jgi:hypothetical protein
MTDDDFIRRVLSQYHAQKNAQTARLLFGIEPDQEADVREDGDSTDSDSDGGAQDA